ncbi:hypothetical protein TMA_089 [Thermus phage TMA]|uniref:hypothetical protein n=1 Tax=Thermus phage TMA TaxID=699370 RepID=UPI00021AADCA|nr:hypothetical protein TMA_089 [Thermus phage TMA]BAK53777.1 hypothetical protein TMA_089 [Thermus phage TMA]
MVEKALTEVVEKAVREYLKKWGIPADGKIGGNVKVGDGALSVRAFVEAPLRRIFVEYIGSTLRGVPEGFNGWANFATLRKGEKNVYIFLDDGFIISEYDGKKLIIEVVPSNAVLPIFRYVR